MRPPPLHATCKAVAVPRLQIDFEDGFSRDTVVVRADGREVWREENVTTNLASNVAAIARVTVPQGARVEVAVPTRDMVASERVETPFLVVRNTGAGLELHPSDELPPHL